MSSKTRSTPSKGSDRVEMEKERLSRSATQVKDKAQSMSPIKLYLVVYNSICTVLWGYILLLIVLHVAEPKPATIKSTSTISRLLSTFKDDDHLLSGFVDRLRDGYEYKSLGRIVVFTQTLAVLEVVHAALGWVRSGVALTFAQIFSRLFAVWGTLVTQPETRSNPLFTSMVFAWSLTEVIRYSFYATQLLGINIPGLVYLRYTLFIVLYPLGASSEALLNFSTLPPFSTFPLVPNFIKSFSPLSTILSYLPTWLSRAIIKSKAGRILLWNMAKAGSKTRAAIGQEWGLGDCIRLMLFFTWPPALYILMSHMFRQRRKVLGGGRSVGQKAKTQ